MLSSLSLEMTHTQGMYFILEKYTSTVLHNTMDMRDVEKFLEGKLLDVELKQTH